MMTKRSNLLLVMIFLLVGTLSADWKLRNDDLSFYPEQEKILRLESDVNRDLVISLYRVNKPLDFIERHYPDQRGAPILFPENPALPQMENGWGKIYVRKYLDHLDPKVAKDAGGFTKVFSFSVLVGKKGADILLPIQDRGLYLLEVRGSESSSYHIVNITDFALFVKRDEERTLVYSVRRKDGMLVPNAKIRPEGFADLRTKEFPTSEKGLLFLPTPKFQKWGKIVGVWSNNYDVVPAQGGPVGGRRPFNLVSFPEKDAYILGESIQLYSYFYRLDEFKDYTEEKAEKYKVIFQGVTNIVDAGKQFFHKYPLQMPPGLEAGSHPVVVEYGGSSCTNLVAVYNDFPRKVHIDIKPAKPVFYKGEKIRIAATVRNAGGKRLRNPAVTCTLNYFDMQTGALLHIKRKKEARLWGKKYSFAKSSRFLEKRNYRVRVDISLRFADGYRMHSYKDFFILKAREDISIAPKKRIFTAGEEIGARVDLVRFDDILSKKKVEVQLLSRQGKEKVIQKLVLEQGTPSTNIAMTAMSPGPFSLRVRVVGSSADPQESDIWVLPLNGDIPLHGSMSSEMEIFSDKDTYSFGDIARILVVSRRKNINSLMTFEGNSVFYAHPMEFQNNYEVIDVPILDKNKPNSVVLIQSIISNRTLSYHKNVHVPYLSKNIVFSFSSKLTNRIRELKISSKNIWDRSVSTFSLLNVSPVVLPSALPQSSLFHQALYHDLYPSVVTFFPTTEISLIQGSRVYSQPIRPGSKEILASRMGMNYYGPEMEAKSNIISLNEDGLYEFDAMDLGVRSVTRDGKVATTNFPFTLDAPVITSLLLPEYVHPDDEPETTLFFRNRSDIRQKIRVKAEFRNDREFRYRTNTLLIPAGEEDQWKARIPRAQAGNEQTEVDIGILTHKKNLAISRALDVIPWPDDVRYSYKFKARKSYRRIGMNMFLVPQLSLPSGSFRAEETVLVTITLHWREGEMPDSSHVFIQDIVPSGFRVIGVPFRIGKIANDRPYTQTDDKVEFVLNTAELRETVRIYYLIKAETPGEYKSVEPLVYMGEFPFSSEKRPLAEKKGMRITF